MGQNIDAYGRDLPGTTKEGRKENTLTDLLYYIHDVKGIRRIRFATSHPRYFSKRLIQACYELDKVCEHFHIPFQSGNDEILKQMSRGYSIKKYKNIIENIRSLMPDASITADAIVAFPGETEQQYQDTLKLISEIGFDQVNTAAYSPRPNTPAAIWSNQLSEVVKKARLQEINDLVEKTARSRNQRYINNIESVLIEGFNPKNSSQIMGRTRTNRLTFVEIPKNINFNFSLGDEIDVKINEARPFSLTGELYL